MFRTSFQGPILLAAVCGMVGCASAPPSTVPAPVRVFPTPPDSPRVQFLGRYSVSTDVEAPNDPGFFDRLIGEEERSDVESINKPYGISARNGTLHVCDTMLPGIVLIDLRAKQFEIWQPGGQGALRKPINCATDPQDGRLFVTDTERGEVLVFSPDRSFLTSFGGGEGAQPTDVFVDDSLAWVTDLRRRTVIGYDRVTLQESKRIPAHVGADSGAVLSGPLSIWATDLNVYVTDFGAMRVAVFDRTGQYIRSVGGYGRELGKFTRPRGLAVDREGLMYVVDAAFNNVQVFSQAGELLFFFGGRGEVAGDMLLPAQITIDYDSVDLFQDRVMPGYRLDYIIYVTNQYGPDRVGVYGRLVRLGVSE